MAIRDLPTAALLDILRGVPAAIAAGNDWIEDELRAAGVDPDDDRAWLLIHKMGKTGVGLCKARTRKGSPCIALGDGAGGRCKNHGGGSTGPTTPSGKARAMAALALARVKRLEGRISNCTLPDAEDAHRGDDAARPAPTSKGTDRAAVD